MAVAVSLSFHSLSQLLYIASLVVADTKVASKEINLGFQSFTNHIFEAWTFCTFPPYLHVAV